MLEICITTVLKHYLFNYFVFLKKMKTGYIVTSDHLVEQQFPADVYSDPLEFPDIRFVGKRYSGSEPRHLGKCYEIEVVESNIVGQETLATKYNVLREVKNLSGELVIKRPFTDSVDVKYTFVNGRLLFFTTLDGTVGTVRTDGTVSLIEFPGGYKAIPKHLILYQETLVLSQVNIFFFLLLSNNLLRLVHFPSFKHVATVGKN